MACDKVSIAAHGRMMIHDASKMVAGNAEELRKQADLLDSISSDIANIYANRTGKSVDDIRAMMKKETWMNAAACIENGFADEQFDIRATSETKNPMNLIEAIKSLLPSVSTDDADKLAAHVAEVETLTADLTDAQSKIEDLKGLAAVVADKDLEISNLTAATAAYQADITAKDETIANLQAEIDQAKADIVSANESAGEKAIEALAAIGQIEPLPLNEGGQNKSILTIFNELKGEEATRFYQINRKAILAEQSQTNS